MNKIIYIFIPKSKCICICCLPHRTSKCNTRPFLVSPGAGPEPTRSRDFLKIPMAPSAFFLLGAPQVPGNKPNPPMEVKAWGDASLRPKETTCRQATPGQVRAKSKRGWPERDLSTGVHTRNLTELLFKNKCIKKLCH